MELAVRGSLGLDIASSPVLPSGLPMTCNPGFHLLLPARPQTWLHPYHLQRVLASLPAQGALWGLRAVRGPGVDGA